MFSKRVGCSPKHLCCDVVVDLEDENANCISPPRHRSLFNFSGGVGVGDEPTSWRNGMALLMSGFKGSSVEQ
jgi:hypothetical protein